MFRTHKVSLMLVLLIATTAFTQTNLPTRHYHFVPVQFPGAASTYIEGINDLFDMVGYYTDTAGNRHGWIFKNHRFRTFDLKIAGTQAGKTYLTGINDRGWVTGGSDMYPTCTGFKHNLYTGQTICMSYHNLGDADIMPNAINDRGTVTGTYWLLTGELGFLFDSAGFRPMIDLFNNLNYANDYLTGISNSGAIVGYTEKDSNTCGSKSFVAKADSTYQEFQISGHCPFLRGISSSGKWMVGDYTDFSENQPPIHTTFIVAGRTFAVQAPGIANFSPQAINSWGVIVGFTTSGETAKGSVGFPTGR